jgi:threonine synthase
MTPRTPSAPTILKCESCGKQLPERTPRTTCPKCGGLLDIIHTPPAARGKALRTLFDRRAEHTLQRVPAAEVSGVWRFRELVMPGAGKDIVSHPEGNTPLNERAGVSQFAGAASLHLKLEGQNPTGSFKDRGMTVAMTQAKRIGASAVACASTGNTSASLASYAAHAGIPALVLVPAGKISLGKLAQTVAYGARTLMVRGNFDDCLRLAREAADELGVYLVNSVNPFRLQGQKTIVFELLQQLGWDAPDWIVLPAGNLGNTSAFGQALVQAYDLGLIRRVPRLAAIQARGAAPFAHAFAKDFSTREPVTPRTVASAIRIGDPASWNRAVHAIRRTNGVVLSVSDREILQAKREIDVSGVGCEPASAASVAGVRSLVASGVIGRKERVVAVLTGHVLKDAKPPRHTAVEIDARLSEVARALKGRA